MKKVTLVLAIVLFAVGGVFAQNPEIIYDSEKKIVIIGSETYQIGEKIPDSYGSENLIKEGKIVGQVIYYKGIHMVSVRLYFAEYVIAGKKYDKEISSKWNLYFNNLTSAEEQITVEVGGEKIEFIFQYVKMMQKKK